MGISALLNQSKYEHLRFVRGHLSTRIILDINIGIDSDYMNDRRIFVTNQSLENLLSANNYVAIMVEVENFMMNIQPSDINSMRPRDAYMRQ